MMGTFVTPGRSRPGVATGRRLWTFAALAGALCVAGTVAAAPAVGELPSAATITKATSAIDAQAIVANANTTKNWLSYGLGYSNQRFSRLDQINTGNVDQLGLVWSYDLKSIHHAQEATPIVVDGVMYVSTPWNIVHAIDVRSGKQIWEFDPKVPRTIGYKGCCDVVSRGVAVWKGKVFAATWDGRLFALDAATGKPIWSVNTFAGENPHFSYTITGAPIVVRGKVIIGNGGAEYGVRGYITAYDTATGKKDWRWYTVPNPAKPEGNGDGSLKMAAKTWDPSAKYWENGGGGTVWNSMAYDPDLNLLYIGVGNGSPWNNKKRSPAGGDNLFLSSVVALNPDTGKYACHYQEVPADNTDFTATQDIILANIKIHGKERKVFLHAPKSGFFYVVDRTNCKFISAKNYVGVNWATGYDKNGRPILTGNFDPDHSFQTIPGPFGGHNWSPMSYSPKTGLAYFVAQNIPTDLTPDHNWERGKLTGEPQQNLGWNLGHFLNVVPTTSKAFGRIIAWDPIQQKQVWKYALPIPWSGGTLATAGNLVFSGTSTGHLMAFNAKTGKELWEYNIGQGAVAGPATYSVDGKQYVSIAVGWGGVGGFSMRATDHSGPGRVFTFALGGTATPPEYHPYVVQPLLSGVKYDPKDVAEGGKIYVENCVICHGVPAVGKGGSIPNLAYVGSGVINSLEAFVFNGPFVEHGMPDFTGKLSKDDVTKIKAFIQGSADQFRAEHEKVGK